jgi:hypothetical protein
VVALTAYIVDADPHALVLERTAEVLSLSSYAMALDSLGVEPGEKVQDFGCRNLVGATLSAWQEQMIAIATRATAKSKPILHFILSLEQGEEWAEGQADEAIDILLQTLGLKRCAVVWSRHGNTANPHLHLCVIRVDKVTGCRVGSKWLVDDLHQSLAIIDERQNRSRTPEALYVAREGVVFDVETGALVRNAEGNYNREWYKPYGRKRNRLPQPLRDARSELIDAAEQAASWQELHEAFSEFDAYYDRKSNGARINRGGKDVKASQVHPSLSRKKLEARLGSFEPDATRVNAAYEAFLADLNGQLAALRERRKREKVRTKQRATQVVEQLAPRQRSLLKRMIEAEAEEAEAAIGKAFEVAIKRCTDQRRTEHQWMAEGEPAYVPVSTPAMLLPAATDTVEQPSQDFVGSSSRLEGWSTAYLDAGGQALFTDHRHFLLVHQVEHVQAIDEALALAAQRWSTVSVQGSAAFLNDVADRAKTLGIEVVDMDGQTLQHVTVAAPAAEAETSTVAVEEKPKRDPAYEQRIAEAIERLKEAAYLPIRRIDDQARREGDDSAIRLELALDDPHGFWDQYLKFDALLDQDDRIQAHLRKARLAVLEELKIHLVHSKPGLFPKTYDDLHACLPAKNLDLHRAVRLMRGDDDFTSTLQEAHAIWLRFERERKEQQERARLADETPPGQARERSQARGSGAVSSASQGQVTDWDNVLWAAQKNGKGAGTGGRTS